MEQILERPGTLEEAFSLLEKGTSVEVKTMDAIRNGKVSYCAAQ